MPDTIRLIVYAVAGGVTGYPVSVVLSGYPQDNLAGVYGAALKLVGDEKFVEIGRTADISKFHGKIHEKRIVLLYPAFRQLGIRGQVYWNTEIRRNRGKPLPAVLVADNSSLGDTPAASLVVHGNQPETDAIASWLAAGGNFPEELVAALSSDHNTAVGIDFQTVEGAFRCCAKHNGVKVLRPRLLYTLRGILAGAAYVNSLSRGAVDPVRVTVEDYREVYPLLKAKSVGPPSRVFDRLTLAMVQRANAWLAFKEQTEAVAASKAQITGVHTSTDTNLAAPRLITLPQISELGNPNSASVQTLCEYLRREKAFGDFKLIGVREDCPNDSDWPSKDPKELAAKLVGWSAKQARTRFDRLREKGVIAATRASNNAPWRYSMPRDAFEGFSPFAGLPPPESLRE